MATREDYPLKAAQELRERDLDDAKASLAQARKAEAHQALQLDAARKRAEDHQRIIERSRAEQRERGRARADELLRDMDYDTRLRTTRTTLNEAIDAQRTLLSEAETAVEARMEELAAARAGHEAVLKHRERWEAERATDAARRVEAEEDDQNNSRF